MLSVNWMAGAAFLAFFAGTGTSLGHTVLSNMASVNTTLPFGKLFAGAPTPESAGWSSLGQLFVAPSSGDHVLNRFSFRVGYQDLGTPETAGPEFDVRIFAWSGTTTTGAALFQSSGIRPTTRWASSSINQGAASLSSFDVSLPALDLTPGGSYIAVLTLQGHNNSALRGVVANRVATVRQLGDEVDLGFRYLQSPVNPAGASWTTLSNRQLAYELEYGPSQLNVVPAPLAVVASGSWLGIMALRRRRGI